MATYIPSSDIGVTWRFKTLYARHLQLSRLEVMEEIDPGHPELQRLKHDSSNRKVSPSFSNNSSSSNIPFSKRRMTHMSLKTTTSHTNSQSFDSFSLSGHSPSIGASSDATFEFPSTSGFPSTLGRSSDGTGKHSSSTIPLRTKRIDFEDLEAELLPSA